MSIDKNTQPKPSKASTGKPETLGSKQKDKAENPGNCAAIGGSDRGKSIGLELIKGAIRRCYENR